MNREVKLLSHLPMYMQNYREMKILQNSIEPEVQNIQDETQVLEDNLYINSCNIHGIERYEKLLNIRHNSNDDIEVRRRRILNIWNDKKPYTYEVLLTKLNIICGEDNYIVSPFFSTYEMTIESELGYKGQVSELDEMLKSVIPANIKYSSYNTLKYDIKRTYNAKGYVTRCKNLYIDTETHRSREGSKALGNRGYVTNCRTVVVE